MTRRARATRRRATVRDAWAGITVVAVAVLVVGVAALGLRFDVFDGFRLGADDALFPSDRADARVAVVGIDRRAILQQAQAWPWSRDVQGRLVRRLHDAGARVIVLDFVYHPATDADGELASALADAGHVVLASSADLEQVSGRSALLARATTRPVPRLARAATAVASANITPDAVDGVVRTLPLVVVDESGRPVPTLALAAVMGFERLGGVVTLTPRGVAAGSRFVPTDRLHLLDINYPAGLTPRDAGPAFVSAADVLSGRLAREALTGKIVLVGVTDPTLSDYHLTPLDKRGGVPGVFIHAAALNTLLTGRYLRPASSAETLAWVALLALLAAFLIRFVRLWIGVPATLAVGAVYLVIAFARFDSGVVPDLLYPSAALVVSAAAAVVVRMSSEARQRQRMSHLLSQYVPVTVADQLLARGRGLPTGEITFLLTDVVGSTVTWEQEPREMGGAMRRHDVIIETAVESHGGAMVRPRGEGDSRFAVFVRPADAAAAAVDIMRRLTAERWPTRSPIQVRAALHTGPAELREGDYYGSVVNRCARIRSTADPGQLLVSAETAARLAGNVPLMCELRDLGERELKDIEEPERVFSLLSAGMATGRSRSLSPSPSSRRR